MFVRMIFSELQNIFLPNLVWWCSIMSQNVKRKKIVCYLQGQGHSKGSYDQSMTLGLIIHHHKPECLVKKKKNWVTAFQVKTTVNAEIFIKFLCILYLLYHLSLGNQTSCADLRLIITEASTTNWVYTDSSTLTYSITHWWWWWEGFWISLFPKGNDEKNCSLWG